MKHKLLFFVFITFLLVFTTFCKKVDSNKEHIKEEEPAISVEDSSETEKTVTEFNSISFEGYELDTDNVVGKEQFLSKEINFITIWQPGCGPCKIELEAFEVSYKKHPEVNFIGLSIAESNEEVKDKINELGLSFNNFRATEKFLESVKDTIKSTPTLLIVDKNGLDIIPMTVGINSNLGTKDDFVHYIDSTIEGISNEKE